MKGSKRARIAARTQGRCWYCGEQLHEVCLDHVVPKTRGGGSEESNLVASCRHCNSRKGTRTLDEYKNYLLYLNDPFYIAAWSIEQAMDSVDSPYDQTLELALAYYRQRTKPIVFYGESTQEGSL